MQKSFFKIVNLTIFLVFIACTTHANNRYLARNKVIIDTKTGIVWLKDANIMKEYTSKKEATAFLVKMNKQNYGGYNNWDFPASQDFEDSFDCRKYKKGYDGMKNFYLKKYRNIGFKNVKAGGYLTCSYTNSGIAGSAIFINEDPTCCTGVPTITNNGYFWPVAHETKRNQIP